MNRDLSEVFMQDDRNFDFSKVEEEMVLPISIENSVIFRFNEKLNNFEFEEEKSKALELISGRMPVSELEQDLESIKTSCADANPSNCLKTWVLTVAISELLIATIFFLIVWVILILDLVILAAELYLLKKFKRIVWKWKKNKTEGLWIEKIEKCLNEFNEKYQRYDLCYKFDSEGKWIQLAHRKSKMRDTMN